MAGVDLNLFRFDYDLTFSALLMNADGKIYHTYGGRTWESADAYLSESTFARVLDQTMLEHKAYKPGKRKKRQREPRLVEDMPAARKRIEQGRTPACYHCHTVHDFMTEDARAEESFRIEDVFRWPDPIQIGLTLHPEDQAVIADVAAGSPAGLIHLRPGDRLLTIEGHSILTLGDVQRALDTASPNRGGLRIAYEREGERAEDVIALEHGWKKPTPLVFSWRPSKWPLSPKPGFGGPQLTKAELETHELSSKAFAFQINYFVTWGPSAHTGRNAAEAGLREGDIVLSLDGKSDFASVDHFHSWFRLTREAGETVVVKVLRGDERKTIELPVLK